MSSTGFGDFMTVGGFNQKTVKEDLFVKANYIIPRRNQLGKTLEQSRRQLIETHAYVSECGTGRPHLQADWPVGPTWQLLLRMSVFHCLKEQIYTVV